METWHFRPRMNIIEAVEWLTDITRCKLVEYRRAMRTIPRISYSFEHNMLDPQEFAAARELARTVSGDELYVPDWPTHAQIPSINAGTVSLPVDASQAPAFKANEYAMVWESWKKWERVRVTNVGTGTISVSATSGAYTNPTVVALRVGRATQPFDGTRKPADWTISQAVFQCLDTEDLSGTTTINWTTYKGAPVMTDWVELIQSVRNTSVREVETVDSKLGQVYKYPLYASPNQQAALAWTAQSGSVLYALRTWLHDMKGRFKSLWSPSWNADLTLTYDVAINDTTIEIAKVGAGYAASYPDNSDFIVITGGAPLCFRVTDVAAGTAGHEVLTLEAPAGAAVTVANTPYASRLSLSRFDADRIEIQHRPGRQATVVVPIVEIPVYP